MIRTYDWDFPPFDYPPAREALVNATQQMLEGTEDSRPSIIVADDVSGRIPGLVVHSALRELRVPHSVYFINGRARLTSPNFSKKPLSNIHNTHALLVTEMVYTGGAIINLMRLLESRGISQERQSILAISATDESDMMLENIAPSSTRFVGDRGGALGNYYTDMDPYTGLKKRLHDDAHSARIPNFNAALVSAARADARRLGIQIVESYRKSYPPR